MTNRRQIRSRRNRRGFTLVEILIVVIILGILAAIVIPQFTNASTDARKSSLTTQLQSLQQQIAYYKLQHNNVNPPLISTGWTVLTEYTDISGNVSATTDATHVYGPYFPTDPTNPLTAAATPPPPPPLPLLQPIQAAARAGSTMRRPEKSTPPAPYRLTTSTPRMVRIVQPLRTNFAHQGEMMARSYKLRRGFTLVEIVIVVIILGILAGVVIPQFSSASQDSRNGALKSQLQEVRSAIQAYRMQHMDQWPDLSSNNWTPLTTQTNAQGGTTGPILYGPYLINPPINVLSGGSTVSTSAAVGVDWVWSPATGTITALDAQGNSFNESP